jgi:hypothetical protein
VLPRSLAPAAPEAGGKEAQEKLVGFFRGMAGQLRRLSPFRKKRTRKGHRASMLFVRLSADG